MYRSSTIKKCVQLANMCFILDKDHFLVDLAKNSFDPSKVGLIVSALGLQLAGHTVSKLVEIQDFKKSRTFCKLISDAWNVRKSSKTH